MKKIFLLATVVLSALMFCSCEGGSGEGNTPFTSKIKLWPACEDGGSLWGFIDVNGKMAIRADYKQTWNFSCNAALVRDEDGYLNFVDQSGKIASSKMPDGDSFHTYFYNNVCGYKDDNLWAFMDNSFSSLFRPKFAALEYMSASGLAACQEEGENEWGYCDREGKMKIKTQFSSADYFDGGVAIVLDNKGRSALINTGGDYLIDPTKNSMVNLGEGRISCKTPSGDKWGIKNTKGDDILEPTFQYIYPYSDGLALIVRSDKYGYVDKSGNYVLDNIFYDAWHFNEGVAWVKTKSASDARWVLIDKGGNEIFSLLPTQDLYDSQYHNGLCLISVNGNDGYRLAYIDKKGEIVYSWKTSSLNSGAPQEISKRERSAREMGCTVYGARFDSYKKAMDRIEAQQ